MTTITATHRRTGKTHTVRITDTGVQAAYERLARKCGGQDWHRDTTRISPGRFLGQPMTRVGVSQFSLGDYWLVDDVRDPADQVDEAAEAAAYAAMVARHAAEDAEREAAIQEWEREQQDAAQRDDVDYWPALAGLEEAGRQRVEAQQAADRAARTARQAVRAARGIVPVAEMARAIGVQRQAVYAWLNEDAV